MVNSESKKTIETEIDELEAFEEWEESTPSGKDTEAHAIPSEEEGPLDFSDLEAPIEEPKASPEIAEGAGEPENFADSLLELAPEVPVNLVAVIGKTTTTVGDLMAAKIGQVIDLGRPPGETVDVVVNGRMIARGELVDMDGQLGVRILKMVR
ncbi:MAG: FliM/FliN family flagellar motor switch protein [Pseudomonadota bacterium]